MPDKRTAEEWLATPEFSEYTVMDPDGWDRANPYGPAGWFTPMTRQEFEQRLMLSTLGPRKRP